MKNILLFALLLCTQFSFAQSARYAHKEQPAYAPEAAEIRHYADNLSQLKTAFSAGDMGQIARFESAVLMSLRGEINRLDERTQQNNTAEQAQQLQVLQNTLQAFDNHAFNPGDTEAATRDFALLDQAQRTMEEVLTALKR